MSSKTCPRCGQPASGNFCGTCGASLKARSCPSCDAPAQSGARFCTRCGGALAAAPTGAPAVAGPRPSGPARSSGGGEAHLGWWAAGGLLVVLMLVVAWPVLSPAPATQPQGAAGGAPAGGGAGPGAVDLSSMTPRQAADQLYGRVMTAAEQGDSATAKFFVPMAVSAYQQARPLDADGLFHLSALQRVAGDLQAALATAQEALVDQPDHLLNLYAAAEAAREMGQTDQARQYFQQLVEVWDAEMASGNVDYQMHANMMDNVRSAAADFLAGTG